MKSLKNLREAIIRAHNRGKGQREIADFLGISPGTVNKAIKRFEETGSYEDRPGRGPKKTARSQENVQRALEMLQQDRSTKTNSTRKLAKKLGVGKDSARRILRMDLKRKRTSSAETSGHPTVPISIPSTTACGVFSKRKRARNPIRTLNL